MITQTVRDLENQRLKENNLLPAYQQSDDSTPNRGQTQRTPRARDGYDYLKAADLTEDKKTAKILSCRLQPDNFDKSRQLVSVKLSLNGVIKLWPVRINNPSLAVLQEAFGRNEDDWVEKRILLWSEEDEHTGKHQIAVEAAPVEPKKKR
jgi:hypothetical protein